MLKITNTIVSMGLLKQNIFSNRQLIIFSFNTVYLSPLVTESLSFQITVNSKHHFNDVRLEESPVQCDSSGLYLSSVKAHFKAVYLCSHEAP